MSESTLLMNAIPARVAGVPQIAAACAAPGGKVPDIVLAAARIAGIDAVSGWAGRGDHRGAGVRDPLHPRGRRDRGPRERVRHRGEAPSLRGVGIDMLAGPSELVVLADRVGEPLYVAADLLSQAEHDEDAFVALVTDSGDAPPGGGAGARAAAPRPPARGILAAVPLPRRTASWCGSHREGVDVVNTAGAGAPGHRDPGPVGVPFEGIRNAGTAFLGPHSPVAVGDYIAGINHTFPTGGAARFSSPLGVAISSKKIKRGISYEFSALRSDAPHVRLARKEGLVAHAQAVLLRTRGKGGGGDEPGRRSRADHEGDPNQALPSAYGRGVGEDRDRGPLPRPHADAFSAPRAVRPDDRREGDVEVDFHHLVEDVGIRLGEAFRRALGEMKGIRRYGHAVVPMIEALAAVTVDVSARPHLVYNSPSRNEKSERSTSSGVEEFLRAFAQASGVCLHVNVAYGSNAHHTVEAVFKALGRAMSVAVELDPRVKVLLPRRGFSGEGVRFMMRGSAIGVVDYGMGNLRSVSKALESLGFKTLVSGDPRALFPCRGIVFPGVGAFRDWHGERRSPGAAAVSPGSTRLWPAVPRHLRGDADALLRESEEFGRHEGIGFFRGKVVRFPPDMPAGDGGVLKVPHMGWNEVEVTGDSPVLRGIPSGTYFSFVHRTTRFRMIPGPWRAARRTACRSPRR